MKRIITLFENENLNVHKLYIKRFLFLSVFSFLVLSNFRVFSQVIVAGTTFDPITVDATKTTYGITEVKQYGVQGGTMVVTAPFPSVTTPGVFNGSPYYAITDNPKNIPGIIPAKNKLLIDTPPAAKE